MIAPLASNALAQAADPKLILFSGYDRVIPKLTNSTILRGQVVGNGVAKGATGVLCTSYQEVLNTLQLDSSVSASGSYAGFTGGVDQKQSLYESIDIATWSVTLVMGVEVGNAWVARNPVPTGPITQDIKSFVARYGNSYISSVTVGGFYYAIYSFHATSEAEQKTVVDSLTADGGLSGTFSVNDNSASRITSVLNSTKTKYSFASKIGGYATAPVDTDPSSIVRAIQQLTTQQPDSAVVLSFETEGYESVLTAAADKSLVDRMAAVRDYFAKPGTGLNWKREQLVTLNQQLAYLKSIYGVYGFNDVSVNANQTVVDSDLAAIKQRVDAYDPAAPVPGILPLPSLGLGTPELSYTGVPAPASWGGPNGPGCKPFSPAAGFDDTSNDIDGWIRSGSRIVALHMRSGGGIDRLTVTYQNLNGKRWQVDHDCGSGGSDNDPPLQLGPNEYITTIDHDQRAFSGNPVIVEYLRFHTNLGQTYVSGPLTVFHSDSGGIYNVPPGTVLVAFGGLAGQYLTALGLIIVRFNSARWQH
jgi:hypothetical protein